MTYKIAHFSDLHLSGVGTTFQLVLDNIDDAVGRGTDLIVISGDVVECAQLDVVEALLVEISARGVEAIVVVGNHDIFPVSAVNPGQMLKAAVMAQTPTSNWQRFNRLLGLHGDEPYPVCLELNKWVVMAAFDTTRNGKYTPGQWVRGELPYEQLQIAARFFDAHPNAIHRIAVMHHYPWEENAYDGPFPLDMVKPEPHDAVALLREIGATVVLCGHLHDNRTIRLGGGLKGIRTAGPEGYAMVELRRDSTCRVKRF